MRRFVDVPRMPGTSGSGMFRVTWSQDGVVIDSAWLTRGQYDEMVHWFKANRWDHMARFVPGVVVGSDLTYEAKYEERAELDFAHVARKYEL